ncbi:copper chaperone PCu(A)C [Thiocystis violacea]|uniref:copper chaperone PCu(A)C n=1 Tax=Thiocystis violacea TaxID=13725 RepID=UPI0019076E93|nr:copper chaperone PCu(A)C [Thiocystis violacea]MBK1718285.1 hypothetical protein [Thiocystis violacea]
MSRIQSLIALALLAGITLGTQAADNITVEDPYARAVPPGQPNSAVFMAILNRGASDRALVGAESPAAKVVELHTHVHEDGMMRMRRVERIDLPAGETVTLKPGGLHVMLIGLKGDLQPGDSVELTLIHDDGEKIQVKAPVRRIEMGQMPSH